eukprot:TRINITY_DN68016_c0_g1_i1.p1 TRINITY_DN68016_c0_g1~~TRINITY_DN68016_c0_g1_i1.p1  ORF type:complete len:276 (+),score=34.86 TRINITY_DN68016_c0_g1_i1:29-856(+)
MSGKKFYTFLSASALALVVTVTGCKKNNTDQVVNVEDISYGKENARIEQTLSDAETFVDQAYASRFLNLKGGNVLGSTCATISVDTTAHTIIVDFSTQNCLCKDSRYRRGKIVCHYTKKYEDTGSVRTISFDTYYVNDYGVEGLLTVTKKQNSNGLYYNINSSATMTTPDGMQKTSRNATQARSYVTGDYSADVYDDEYYIDGYGDYTHSNGGVYTFSIEQHLRVNPNCDWPKEGIVEMIQVGGSPRVFNYGPVIGCDRKATMTVNEVVNEVLMD